MNEGDFRVVMAAGLGVGGDSAAVAVPVVHIRERALSPAVVLVPVYPVCDGEACRDYLMAKTKPRL